LVAAASVFLSRRAESEGETGTQWRAVTPSPVENHITLLAHVQAAEQYLVSAPFDSHISQLSVQEGQEVHKGDPLLVLDTTPLQIEYRDGQAQFLKARQSLRNLRAWENSNEVMSAQRALVMAEMGERDAASQLNAAEPLYHQGIIARSERDSLAQQLASRRLELQAARQALTSVRASGSAENQTVAELELNNAEQKLQQIRDQQARSWLYAPGDGYAVRIQNDDKDKVTFPRLGQRVGAGEPLFMLATKPISSICGRVCPSRLPARRCPASRWLAHYGWSARRLIIPKGSQALPMMLSSISIAAMPGRRCRGLVCPRW